MNWLIRSVSCQGLLKKLVRISRLRKLYRPTNPNSLALPYHQKSGDSLTSSSQKHFVKSFTSIADKLNSVQQPAGTARLSGEIVLGGFAA